MWKHKIFLEEQFMNRAELKQQAKQQIKGKIGILFLITLIVAAISFIIAAIPYVGAWILLVIAPAFSISLLRIYLMVAAGKMPEAKDAFSGFDDIWSALKLTFFTGLFTYLWSLLFIIPGIIKSYEYSMSFYILAENKGKPALECIKESREMTKGHKMELFVLSLSFIGWSLLGYITFGIAYIWVLPYMQTTLTNAYNSFKSNKTTVSESAVETSQETTEK